MRFFVIALVLLTTPALAAESKTPKKAAANPTPQSAFNFLHDNPGFTKKYLKCDEAQKKSVGKSSEQLSCDTKISLKYCAQFDRLSPDVQKKLDMELGCNFLAGEIRGDNSPFDKKTIDSMREMGCLGNDTRTVEMLRQYWGKETDMRGLLFFSRDYMDAEAECVDRKDKPAKR